MPWEKIKDGDKICVHRKGDPKPLHCYSGADADHKANQYMAALYANEPKAIVSLLEKADAKTQTCPDCNQDCPAGDTTCPNCGCDLTNNKDCTSNPKKPNGKSFAYSTFVVKSVSEDQRVIKGIASTPSTDRVGDIVESDGAQFTLPLPLLWQHEHNSPIGHVTEAKATKNGIEITAQMPIVKEAGKLKDRLDEAWQSIKHGLVRGLSIGFTPLESKAIGKAGAFGSAQHYLKWNWHELSAVTIPANADANIMAVKNADMEIRKVKPVVRLDDEIKVEVHSNVPLEKRKSNVTYL